MNHYKETIRLGVPIMLGQLGIIIVGFADNMMVGHHNALELAAASFVNNFFNLAFIFGMGFSYGLTPIIGQLFARKEFDRIGSTLRNSMFINGILGLFLTACMTFLYFNLDWLDQPKELYPLIKPYYILQLISIPFVMLFNSFKQFSDGTTDTLTPMYIMLSANVLNIIGNYFLIFGYAGFPELGLTGAGLSTLVSRVLSLLFFCILFIRHSKYAVYLKGFKKAYIKKKELKELTRIGLPIGFQMGIESGSFNLAVIMMGWIGSTALAAYQIAGVVTTLGFMLYYGIAAAVSIRISNFKGNKDMDRIRESAKAGFVIVGVCILIDICFLLLFRNNIGYLFTTEDEVVKMVAVFCWPVICYQLGDGMQILFANALRGITDVKYMAKMALFCHFGLALPIGYICGFTFDYGALGIWFGFPISLTLLAFLLGRRFILLTRNK